MLKRNERRSAVQALEEVSTAALNLPKQCSPNPTMATIALPVELLQAILSHIQQRKYALSCTLVCKNWNVVATIRLYEAGLKPETMGTLV
jgi:hypothetical protein